MAAPRPLGQFKGQFIKPAPQVSVAQQDAFFARIKKHCGKSFLGKVTANSADSTDFDNKKLVMHVRRCTDTQLQIPFHVGKDASRTWIISKTGSGLQLKHDHRMANGDYDEATMYGGHTVDAGWPNVQSFPADAYSKDLLVKLGMPQSISNIWHLFIYDDRFSYRLVREGLEFQVDFDLTRPIRNPSAPWGYKN